MVLFRHRSIRRDLVVIIMTVSLLCIMLTSFAISFLQYRSLQQKLIEDLGVAVDIVAQKTESLVGFEALPNIKRRIFAGLNVLMYQRSISMACIYSPEGTLIAFYDATKHEITHQANQLELSSATFDAIAKQYLRTQHERCPKREKIDTSQEARKFAIARNIYQPKATHAPPVNGDSALLGSLYIEANLDILNDQMDGQMITTAIVSLCAMIVCYLLAVKMQRTISHPILQLSQAAKNVTVYKDYSVRVDNPSEHYSEEISQLINSFNAMLKDIGDRDSKLQRKNLELERAKEMAESANMSKSQFLANISHELRTPLNAIIGFSSIIINQMFGPIGNDKYTDYAKDINDSGVHLLDIINDILDLSKAEAGKLSLRLESFDITDAIKKCEHIMAERAMEAGVSISLNLASNMPPIIADRVRFIQIILNLLSNAVKFTKEGGRVEVRAEYEPAGDEVHYFTFCVSDNGIGMRKEDIDMAFQTFGQVDSGLDRKYDGTGLGLPLTKKLVELHNGSIRIDSSLHQGTSVTIRLISDKALL